MFYYLRRMIGTYEIVNKINGKRYVGSSSDIPKRINQHKCHLRKNKHHCKPLQNAFNKYGESSFVFNTLELCGKSELEEKENNLLASRNLYNTFKEAYAVRGASHPMYGKTHTKEARSMIKAARATQTIRHSEETKRKISEGNKGKKMPEGHAAKMVAARGGKAWNKGIKTGIEPASKIKFTDKQSGNIIKRYVDGESIERIRLSLGYSWDTIRGLLKSKGIETRTLKHQIQLTHARKTKRTN